MPNYIGFASTQHDPAVAIVVEGKLVYAQGNERGLKNKRAHNCVPDSIGVLEEIKAYLDDDIIAALSWSDKALKYSPSILRFSRFQKSFIKNYSKVHQLMGLRQAMYKAPSTNKDMLINLEYRLFENGRNLVKKGFSHHLCHAATAFYTSPFEQGIVVVLDGIGEGSSYSIYEVKNQNIKTLVAPYFNMASLGFVYSNVCQALNFDPLLGEEWKVMGLAAYGKKSNEIYDLIKPMLCVNKTSLKKARDYDVRVAKLLSYQSRPEDHANLACTAQIVFEEIVFEFLNEVYKQFPHNNLMMAGGCLLNSSCNGKILQNTPFKNLHIPMAPGDDGNAIGAAFVAWQEKNPGVKHKPATCPYLGSSLKPETFRHLIKFSGLNLKLFDNSQMLCKFTAQQLASGKLVGWFQGKAEFGPRALGNRSILASPQFISVKDEINNKVKFREKYRPFAPSILHEYGEQYFEHYSYTPYMEKTLKFIKSDCPGVIHVDGTGRLQSVTRDSNEKYYELIEEFRKITGIPILLNTSFNIMGRPIVHDIEDALGMFYTSGLDILIINQVVIIK